MGRARSLFPTRDLTSAYRYRDGFGAGLVFTIEQADTKRRLRIEKGRARRLFCGGSLAYQAR